MERKGEHVTKAKDWERGWCQSHTTETQFHESAWVSKDQANATRHYYILCSSTELVRTPPDPRVSVPTYLFFLFFFFRPSQIILLPCSSNVAKIARFSKQNLQLLHFLADANQKCTRCERRPNTSGKNRRKWQSSNSSSNEKRNAVGPWTSSSSSATRRRRGQKRVSERPRDRERERDGWMRDGWSSSHPLFILDTRFASILFSSLLQLLLPHFTTHQKKKKLFFFLFPFSTQFFKLSISFRARVSFFPH